MSLLRRLLLLVTLELNEILIAVFVLAVLGRDKHFLRLNTMQYAPSAAVYLLLYQKDPKGSSNVTFGNKKQRKTQKQMSAERKRWRMKGEEGRRKKRRMRRMKGGEGRGRVEGEEEKGKEKEQEEKKEEEEVKNGEEKEERVERGEKRREKKRKGRG